MGPGGNSLYCVDEVNLPVALRILRTLLLLKELSYKDLLKPKEVQSPTDFTPT